MNQGAQNLLLPIQLGTVSMKYHQRMQEHGSYSCFLLPLPPPPPNFLFFPPLFQLLYSFFTSFLNEVPEYWLCAGKKQLSALNPFLRGPTWTPVTSP